MLVRLHLSLPQILILSRSSFHCDIEVISPRFDICAPAAAQLPNHMRSQDYRNPTQSTLSAFAYATGSDFWDHLNKNPTQLRIFNDFMATRRQGRRRWYDTYPVRRELLSIMLKADGKTSQEDRIILVDVGGNRGHDLAEVKSRNPELTGKMILQDLPEVIAHVSFDTDGGTVIKVMAHDFFEPQPVRRIYPFFPLFRPSK